MIFEGVNSPVITIMTDDGKIDYPNMGKHINRLINAGLNGLLFFGSLGEFYGISLAEKKEFIDWVVKVVNKRTQVIIGIGDTSLDNVLDLARYSEKAGVDALNIVSTYYFGLNEQSTVSYFAKVAEAVKLPIMLYNFPDRTGNDLTPELVCELAEKYPNIIGIKDTVDNISHTRRLCQKIKPIRPDFSILSGFDEYYLVNRISGGDGVLCGLTNVIPEDFVQFHKAFEAKDFVTMEKMGKKISYLMQLYQITPLFIVAIKSAVKISSGLDMSLYTKAPASPLTKEQEEKIKTILLEAN
ncbi:dihydrodipicolinate synthase family protein [Lonepinella koalarum]|uniref:4-hydroxy-tetrahydrodipicolinate synthase n=1 Tax=Lonepinella koalarum TaxID=53417 RepID=A0A4R1KQ88_9PAST|nr:dihydrodipicolinate synthase family protein [Lonepinella koalarum]MDH2925653.1 dihydrodipicolinate synthase family protein [Lonepinella koalarum]TCK67152.1 4-hydroxy-tetrahydrodipicolinate synthase [Lonepinella koalarum]TFJ89190.1 dihydrodipicolinate synthase family protein [Lonepinella koalarum]TYG34981.1 dihydrodipicolinate synthase family protein [Lonepinella koalarum]